MSEGVNGRADGADSVQRPDNAGAGAAARKTPDDYVAAHARRLRVGSRPESYPPGSAHENDFPRLSQGESLAGRFTILRFIAQGGIGAVYEASDVMLRSGAALKVLRGRSVRAFL